MALIRIYDLTTLDGKKEEVSDSISAAMTATVRTLITQSRGISQLVFANPRGLTPQQVCDAMGRNAASILITGQGIAQIVNSLRPNTIDISPPLTAGGLTQTVVPNQDGTVTIVES